MSWKPALRLSHVAWLVSLAAVFLAAPIAGAVTDNADSLYVGAGQTYTLGGTHTYNKLVKVEATGILYVTSYTAGASTGWLDLRAPVITIAGTINGDGRGYRGAGNYQEGPGCGGYPGGGAGHGGAGGASGHGGSGGVAYGTSSGRDIEKGSGGGDTGGGLYGGGNGGALVKLNAASLTVSGSITSNGTAGLNTTWGAGGASGGGIYIEASSAVISGTLSARGGAGGNGTWGGGGGAGGRIKIFYCTLSTAGSTITTSGGSGGTGSWPGSAGGAGTYYTQFVPEPDITAIVDVRNDQGRQVRITWARACYDDAAQPAPVTHYTIWRRIDPLPLVQAAPPAARLRALAYPPGSWDFVADVPARGETSYNTIVPTLADSNSSGMHRSVFFVSGVTANPFVYHDSAPDSGYSVDNLPPYKPAPFTANWSPGTIHLHWGANTEADFSAYELHRGDTEGFVPGPGNLIASKPDTGYADAVNGWYYYKLRAVDVNGNGSSYALLRPQEISGSGGPPLAALWLGPAVPNPTTGGATVAFGLTREGYVSLVIYDIQGRPVRTLLSGRVGAGQRSAAWDGRDATGRLVSAGLYFYQLEAEGRRLTGRLAIAR